MKKRNLSRFFMGMLAMCAITACSDNELGNEPVVDSGASTDAVYMNVTVQLPTGAGTRSETNTDGGSSDGTEVGQPYENNVNSVLLVLATTGNEYIGCAEKYESLTTKADGTVTTVQSISKSVLSTYYGEDGVLADGEEKINVFVFCNPTSALRELFENVPVKDKNWYNSVCSVSETPQSGCDNATIWGGPEHQGGFLMSSYQIAEKKIPANFSDWNDFTKADHPFLLTGDNPTIGGSSDKEIKNGGTIKVERSVARFDFKDGSPTNNRTYEVVKDPNNNGKYIVNIELQKMALVNMSKNFYYLRRVSDNGLDNGFKLCGVETNDNYVVDTDAAAKNDGSIISEKKYTEHFNFCLGDIKSTEWVINAEARKQWFTSKISDVLQGKDDNNTSWNNPDKYGDYKIWRYATENTIPGETSNQTNGISTGIVFKGQMIVPEGTEGTLADAINNATGVAANDPILYVYGNDIFVRWTEVRAKAIAEGQGSPLYKAAFGNAVLPEDAIEKKEYSADTNSADYLWNKWFNGGKEENALKAFKAAATGAGFTLYESSKDEDYGDGYYCYYFYWNRHNDNGNNGVMRPMEFAVVRNNVYKLAVTNIKKLGHPRVTENDPDPVDPNNPDEEGDVYLSVDVEVLPWVVRVNDIEFD